MVMYLKHQLDVFGYRNANLACSIIDRFSILDCFHICNWGKKQKIVANKLLRLSFKGFGIDIC